MLRVQYTNRSGRSLVAPIAFDQTVPVVLMVLVVQVVLVVLVVLVVPL